MSDGLHVLKQLKKPHNNNSRIPLGLALVVGMPLVEFMFPTSDCEDERQAQSPVVPIHLYVAGLALLSRKQVVLNPRLWQTPRLQSSRLARKKWVISQLDMRPEGKKEELLQLSVPLQLEQKSRNALLVLLAASQSSQNPAIVDGPAIELSVGASVLCQPAAIARCVCLCPRH